MWNQISQLWTRGSKLIKKLRFKRPKQRKENLLLSREILSGSRMRKKNHHLDQFPCTASIQIKNIQMFHLIDLPLLFYMMLHFLCIWKNFIVHPSWKRFLLKGICWFKKNITLLAIILNKSLMPSLSTFEGRKLAGRESEVWNKIMELWRKYMKMKFCLIKLMKSQWK